MYLLDTEALTERGLPVGANTGQNEGAQPFWVKGSYSLPKEIQFIKDPTAKVYATVRVALEVAIGLIVTANPSMVLRYARALEEWKEELSLDLRRGTLQEGPASLIEPDLRQRIEAQLVPSSVPLDWGLSDVWPLQVISCWKGGPAQLFCQSSFRCGWFIRTHSRNRDSRLPKVSLFGPW